MQVNILCIMTSKMPEVPGASEHSVYNAKLSLVRIYLFKYASAVLRQLGQLR